MIPGNPFTPDAGNTASILMQQMMMQQLGQNRTQQWTPPNMYQQMGNGPTMQSWQATPDFGQQARNRHQEGIFRAATNSSIYAARPPSQAGAALGVNMQSNFDRRADLGAVEGLYNMGMINKNTYHHFQGNTGEPGQIGGASEAQMAIARQRVGAMINTNPIANSMYGEGMGNSADVAIGMSALSNRLIEGDVTQGIGGGSREQRRLSKGIMTKQLSRYMMDEMFTGPDGGFNESYGNSQQVGTVLEAFSKSGSLGLEDLMKKDATSGQMTMDPETFKKQLGDKVKAMTDTFDALEEVYGEMDPAALIQMSSEMTGLDSTNAKHADRINKSVRQSLVEAESFGMDPRQYMSMIAGGAQTLARQGGYDQMGAGMISQMYAGSAGTEAEMQRAMERGYEGPSGRSGFRSMSTEDIHQRNMLNFAGVNKDKPLANVTMGMVEALRNEELVGGTMTDKQKERLSGMINNGPSSRGEMMEFARELQDSGINIMNKKGTMEQRMSMLQPDDIERLATVRRGAVRATNREQGFNNLFTKSLGLRDKGFGEDDIKDLQSVVGQVGGERVAQMMSAITSAKTPEEKRAAQEGIARTFADEGSEVALRRGVSQAGSSMKELEADGKGLDTFNANTKLQEKLAKLTGMGVDEMRDTLFDDTGTLDMGALKDSFGGEQASKLQSMITSQRDDLRGRTDANGNRLFTDKEIDQQVQQTVAGIMEAGALSNRNAETGGGSDADVQRSQEGVRKAKKLAEVDKKKKEQLLRQLDIDSGDGLFTGMGDGMDEGEISTRIDELGISRGDLRGRQDKIRAQIHERKNKIALDFATSNDGVKGMIGGHDEDEFGLLNRLIEDDVDGGDENALDDAALDDLADTMGIEADTSGVDGWAGMDEEERAEAQGEAKRGIVKERLRGLRKRMRDKKQLSSPQKDLLTLVSKEALDKDSAVGQAGLVDVGDADDGVHGLKDKQESEEVKKQTALEKTMQNIEKLLATEEDTIQRVTFEGPMIAEITDADGSIRVAISRSGNN